MHCKMICVHEYHRYKQVVHSQVVNFEMLIINLKNQTEITLFISDELLFSLSIDFEIKSHILSNMVLESIKLKQVFNPRLVE